MQVRPVDAHVQHAWIAHGERAYNIFDDRCRRRGGEREDGRASNTARGVSDLQERGSEIMTPLRNAVGFVDDY